MPKRKPPKRCVFNKANENISWARWSWNPITGCKHGCPYCYAVAMAKRFYPEVGFTPTFHEDRLGAPKNTPVPESTAIRDRAVFTVSMGDMFGKWVPQEWIDAVMKAMEGWPQWQFLTLTKNPRRLPTVNFPDNCWVGATVDRQSRLEPTLAALRKTEARIKWISFEPLEERITVSHEDLGFLDWIVIGARSGHGSLPEFQPEVEWLIALTHAAVLAGAKLYWKPNLRTDKFREHPDQ